MRDIDLRQALRESLTATCAPDSSTVIVEELGLFRGAVRADIVVINGNLKGYEIKSDRDTLSRLANQAVMYSRVFDTVTIVLADRHLERAVRVIPDWWGIEVAVTDAAPTLRLSKIRTENLNSEVDPFALVQLLWRDEALALLGEASPSEQLTNRPRRFLWQALVAAVPLPELKALVRTCLKNRKYWRADLQQTRCDEKFQPYAMSSGFPYPPVRSRSHRYTHRPS